MCTKVEFHLFETKTIQLDKNFTTVCPIIIGQYIPNASDTNTIESIGVLIAFDNIIRFLNGIDEYVKSNQSTISETAKAETKASVAKPTEAKKTIKK